MSESNQFDRLLDALPRIADAVNAFSSEEVQNAAFSALVAALNLPPVTPSREANDAEDSAATGGRTPAASHEVPAAAGTDGVNDAAKPNRNGRVRKPLGAVSAVKGTNFWPEDKTSLTDFVAEKAPSTNYERNLVAVYYLEQVLQMTNVTAGHVLGAYKASNWREPADPINTLQATASQKHWIDTADSKAIKTTPAGRNMVEHTMPVAKQPAGKRSK